MNHRLIFVVFLALSGCASNHNMRDSGQNYLGGGYYVEKINSNVYRIVAKTNYAPYKNLSGVRLMWAEQAEKVCGSSEYKEEYVKEYTYKHAPDFIIIPYIVTVKVGNAICGQSPLTSSSTRTFNHASSLATPSLAARSNAG